MVSIVDKVHQRTSGKAGSLQVQSPGPAGALLFVATIKTSLLQEVVAVDCGGIPMERVAVCQIGSDLRTEVWTCAGAFSDGPLTINWHLNRAGDIEVGALSLTGCKNPAVYYQTTGIGQGVSSIPLRFEMRAGGMILGCGAGLSDAQANVAPWQTEMWNSYDGNFRSQCIAAFPNMDGVTTVANQINKPDVWAIALVGVDPA